MYCAVPENIHTHPKEGQWKIPRGRGVSKAQFFKGKYDAKLDFLEECVCLCVCVCGGGGGLN